MNGAELSTFLEELNGGASIGDALALQLLNLAKEFRCVARPATIVPHGML